ncbi:MAG: L,D-transpeptidase [Xanthobacteraceae bacterium]
MVDYYSTLLRAVTAPGAGDAQWRYAVYDRARRMLSSRLHTLKPPPPPDEIAAEEAALAAAIERIEQELSWTEQGGIAPDARTHDRFGDIGGETRTAREEGLIAAPSRRRRAAWIAAAVVAAALLAGAYVYWVAGAQPSPAGKTEAQNRLLPAQERRAAADNDLAPGVDGGNSDPDMAYVFRRQPTFYRTLEPVGTIIVDKAQHYLYLIQSNTVALRYGIAVGRQCVDLAGLRHIASMAEWPPWQPPPDLLKRTPAPLPGGPGNPLGARLLDLDDGGSRINGTNAPKTIGNFVAFGCIRLANDDVADLYGRVKVSTPVVVN